ncbi:unnamed protein product [Rhodiola kirilowii]
MEATESAEKSTHVYEFVMTEILHKMEPKGGGASLMEPKRGGASPST